MYRTTCAVTLSLTLAIASACGTEDPPPEATSEAVSGRPSLPDEARCGFIAVPSDQESS